MSKAVFLDRDGVINKDFGYVHQIQKVEFLPGIFDFVARAKNAGFLVIIVTNQAGIGRGYYSEKQFHTLMRWITECFAEQGGRIDDYFFCPHHPEARNDRYRKNCEWRKPSPGMLKAAIDKYEINVGKSLMIGDRITDMQAAHAVNIPVRYILSPKGHVEVLRDMARVISSFEEINLTA